MFSDVYKTIERKYEDKRMIAEKKYALTKEKVYSENPRLSEIDKEITMLGIKSSRAALTSDASDLAAIKKDLETQLNKLKQEKSSILSSINVSLSPKYQCEKCKDTGYITNENGTIMCNCLKQELIDESYNKSNMFRLKNDTFDKFDLNQFSDSVDVQKFGVNVSPRQNMAKIREMSMTFIDKFEEIEQKNLLFTGTPGIGKTFLSSCIANELINKRIYSSIPNITITFRLDF